MKENNLETVGMKKQVSQSEMRVLKERALQRRVRDTQGSTRQRTPLKRKKNTQKSQTLLKRRHPGGDGGKKRQQVRFTREGQGELSDTNCS